MVIHNVQSKLRDLKASRSMAVRRQGYENARQRENMAMLNSDGDTAAEQPKMNALIKIKLMEDKGNVIAVAELT